MYNEHGLSTLYRYPNNIVPILVWCEDFEFIECQDAITETWSIKYNSHVKMSLYMPVGWNFEISSICKPLCHYLYSRCWSYIDRFTNLRNTVASLSAFKVVCLSKHKVSATEVSSSDDIVDTCRQNCFMLWKWEINYLGFVKFEMQDKTRIIKIILFINNFKWVKNHSCQP